MSTLQALSVRETLRLRTADVHARLERIPTMQRLLAGSLAQDEYVQLLLAYRRFYRQAELPLRAGFHILCTHGLDVAEREMLALIDDDLFTLGISVEHEDGSEKTVSVAPTSAVGWVWVSEGSSLGAQLIDRALDPLFGARRAGRRFFETRADQSLRWRAVCASMEHYGRLQDTLEPLVNGALDAFGCIERSFMRIPR